jgi:hypothetical protein
MLSRRNFLALLPKGLMFSPFLRCMRMAGLDAIPQGGQPPQQSAHEPHSYGSGYFGNWEFDDHGLAAYHYTCDQIHDPKAKTPVETAWRSNTDHTHQVGNDRILAAVSNYGHMQVRQDEGAPKFLNDYLPEAGFYGGGLGYLTDGKTLLTRIMREGLKSESHLCYKHVVRQCLWHQERLSLA